MNFMKTGFKDGDSVWIVGDGVFLPATVAERLIYESPRLHAALFVYFDDGRPRFPTRIDELSDIGLAAKLRMPSIANLPYVAVTSPDKTSKLARSNS